MTKKVRVIKASNPESWYADKIGEVFEVADDTRKLGGGETYSTVMGRGGIRVADTALIHEIDGVLYEEVERKAEVGEKIIVISTSGWYSKRGGEVFEVISGLDYVDAEFPTEEDAVFVKHRGNCKGCASYVSLEDYRVLVPVTPESDADIIANLTRRVFALENARTSDGALLIEAFTEMLRKRDKEIGELRELVEMLTDDVVTLDERTQPRVVSEKARVIRKRRAEAMWGR